MIYPHSKDAMCFEEMDAADYGESRWQIQEGKEYEYEFVDDEGNPTKACFVEKAGLVCPRRRRNEGTIRTGIYVGNLVLEVEDWDGRKLCDVSLEIRSVKTSYREDYRTMMEDITQYYTDLVMQQGSPVTQKFEVDNDAEPQTLYQKFAFVKSIVDSEAFEEAMHKVVSNPVRSWTGTTVVRHVENVRRLNRNGIRQMASSTDRVRLGKRTAGLDSLPRTLEVPYKRDTTDTNENQFVKYVLTQFYSFCTDIAGKKKASEQLKLEANVVCNILLRHLGSGFFRDISLPQHMNLNSPVLQRKEGYREILQGWLIFDLAAKLTWKGGDNVYDAGKKNVAALYEYWLFFKLLDVVSSVFRIDAMSKEKLVVKDSDQLNLDLKQGRMKMISGVNDTDGRKLNVRFYYNRTFGHREDMHSAGSWTMPMRPDYTLSMWPGDISEEEAEREELIVHVHFDAKYRVNKIMIENEDSNLDDIDNEDNPINRILTEDKENEESGKYEIGMYKRADILKMHAYKDAIRRTSGAYILYPGTEPSTKKGFHEIIPGLGAFCVSPGNDSGQIADLKQFLISVKEHLLNRTSQREKMAYQSYTIYKDEPVEVVKEQLPEAVGENRDFMADETYVILGYVKNEERLNWVLKKCLYNGRAGTRKGSVELNEGFAKARYLLLHTKTDCYFYKLSGDGPKVWSGLDLIDAGYPQDRVNEYEYYERTYLMFEFEKRCEKEFDKYHWDVKDVLSLKKKKYEPEAHKLTDLIRIANVNEK